MKSTLDFKFETVDYLVEAVDDIRGARLGALIRGHSRRVRWFGPLLEKQNETMRKGVNLKIKFY